jgi:FKBP-type peptidyl-prolyl cis-trans isomerase
MLKSLLPVFIVGTVLALLVFAASCTQKRMHRFETRTSANPNSNPSELAEKDRMANEFPDTLLSTTGLRYKILTAGSGPKPVAGNRVKAHYAGRLLDGTEFDSSYKRGEPFEFTLLKGEVIKGWDNSVIDMQKGEKRLVIVPFKLGYGERGSPPDIPARATLVFEIELVDFQ